MIYLDQLATRDELERRIASLEKNVMRELAALQRAIARLEAYQRGVCRRQA